MAAFDLFAVLQIYTERGSEERRLDIMSDNGVAAEDNLKTGEVMLPFRIMLVGGKFGPQVFDIAALLGKNKTLDRIAKALTLIRE